MNQKLVKRIKNLLEYRGMTITNQNSSCIESEDQLNEGGQINVYFKSHIEIIHVDFIEDITEYRQFETKDIENIFQYLLKGAYISQFEGDGEYRKIFFNSNN